MTNSEKNAARKERVQQRLESGLISEHFPEVSSIVINMKNSYKRMNSNSILRTLNFLPSSYAYFNIECLSEGCRDGGFDLNQVIAMMIRSHKDSGEGELDCDSSSLSPGHSHIHYKVNIQYN
jgi:hypothetical protein